MVPLEQARRAEERNRLYGVYPALVTEIDDPDGQGRVKVRLPWLPDDGGYNVLGAAGDLHGRREPRLLVHPRCR
jgi:hypothetical protein